MNASLAGTVIGLWLVVMGSVAFITRLDMRVAELEKQKPTPVVVGAASVGETNKTSP